MYKTIVAPVILHVCETWSLTFGDEYTLQQLENKVLKKTFGLAKCNYFYISTLLHNCQYEIYMLELKALETGENQHIIVFVFFV
jgi:hypothetical protein